MLAILKAGGAYVPLDPSYPPERLHFMLQDAGITVVLTQAGWLDSLQTDRTKIICLEQEWNAIAQESSENLSIACTADQPAYVIYTSGSTGTPKGVIIPHRAVNRLVCETNYVQIKSSDRIAQVANLAFDAATFEVWGALLNGAQLIGIERETTLSPTDFVNELQQQQISILFLTTALFNQTVSQIPTAFRSLHYLLFGGEVVNVDRVRTVMQQSKPQHLIHVYGPTENTTFSSWYEIDNILENATTIPIGQAVANTQIYLLDENLNPVPANISGEIYLGGDGLAQGYLNRPELTAERFIDHPIHPSTPIRLYKTGDRALYRSDGNFEFLGRTDHQIKIRGFRVELGEIEAAIVQHSMIQTAVVVTREIEGDNQLIAYVVPNASATPTERDLRSFLKRTLPAYMLPAAFVMLDRLPLTANGKVDQKALPPPTLTIVNDTSPIVAPTTSLEASLVELWIQLLGRKQVGIHDNFFELGGHSLLATQLVSRIRDRFQIEVPLRSVFETPTIAELGQLIKTLKSAPQKATPTSQKGTLSTELCQELTDLYQEKEEEREKRQEDKRRLSPISPSPHRPIHSSPLSFAQQRLWFLYQLEPDNPFYNVPAAIRLTGTLDRTALERSFNQIVYRHAALRTTFTTVDGQPVQVVAPNGNVKLAVVNLQTVAASEREHISQQLAIAEAQRPFNLTADPLLRLTLLQFSPTEAVLLLTMHHIVADGWSLGVLIRELGDFYTAFVEGRSPTLPALPIQYTDFACWQRNWLQGEVLEKQLAYWRTQLQDLPVLDLPTDRPRPAMQTYRGATYPLQISPALTQALVSLSQQSGTSLFITLLAAFQTLLYRYTGQEDIAIGSPIANRSRSEVEGLIGFFVNSLVIRSDISKHPTFREFLEEVEYIALQAYEHQDLPFEKLVEELDPERDLSRNPLFQIAFALQNAPMQPLELPGLTLEPAPLQSGSTRFDLEVHLWEPAHGLRSFWQSQDGLSGFISYSTDLFERDRIQRLVRHFQTLLEGIVANPDDRLSDLPLLTSVEYQQIVVEWNQTDAKCTDDRCFHQIFEAQVQSVPEAIALVSEQETLTYRELNQRADRLAQTLRQMGVEADSLVGLCVDRSADMVIGILGILKAGGAYVPLDPNYPSDRLRFMLTDAHVSILLTQSWLVETLPASSAKIFCVDQLCVDQLCVDQLCVDQPLPLVAPHRNRSQGTVTPDHLAYVIYTSGSTGTPKGVLLSHRGLCNVVAAQHHLFHPSRTSRILQFSSLSFDASIFEIALAFGSGSTLYIPPKSAQLPGIALVQFLNDHAITHALLTPSVLALLPSAELPTLQVLITGGETCSSQVIDRWATNRHFFNAYGPTETTIFATIAQLHPGDRPLTIGRPILNAQVYILDNNLNPVPVGIPGELYIGGAGVAHGYLNRSDLTAERFIPNPFERELSYSSAHPPIYPSTSSRLYKTGDRALYHPDGTIEFLGRVDHQVKIRGFRVELGEIEATLQRHPAIREAVVIPSGEPTNDMRLITYFSLNPQHLQQTILQSLQTQQLQHWQTLYNQTYNATDTPVSPNVCPLPFNTAGWNSSYTGEPIPTEQMQEWVSDRVQQILALKPNRILEIGCGTGLLLFPIAPHCQQYVATDFSTVALESIQTQLNVLNLSHVELLHRVADDFRGIDLAAFDVVILNSIVQYFPSQNYFMQVLEEAIQRVAIGGVLFIGDVRSLPLLTAFHTWVQFCRADASLERIQLQHQVNRSQFEEPELAIDPAFFYALRDRFPQIQQVQVRLSRGRSQNEMTQFRYNVLLHIQQLQISELTVERNSNSVTRTDVRLNILTQSRQNFKTIQQYDWKLHSVTVEEIKQTLIKTEPEILTIANVTNSRVSAAVKTANWLRDKQAPKTVGQMREVLQNIAEPGIDPQDWWDLETMLPYTVEITWSTQTRTGDYDIVLIRHDIDATIDWSLSQLSDQSDHQYTNAPLQSNVARQLIPELRQYLRQILPDYMVPTAFIPLGTLPLTASGKVDRTSVAEQYRHTQPTFNQNKNYVCDTKNTSLTKTETTLIDIWKELLQIKYVDIHDNFFELGGHSLLATQMTSRVRDVFGLELPLKSVFEAPTIARLSPILETLRNTTLTSETPALVRIDRSAHRRKRSTLPNNDAHNQNSTAKTQNAKTQNDTAISNQSVTNTRSPLVPLTLAKNPNSSKPPFFCIHPMFGVVFPYLELAHHLGSDRSFYGLQPLGLDGKSAPLNRIEAIATYYIQAIQTIQPHGPYYLGGWSFGGLVAFEMAQQLTQAGEQIDLLAILDTTAPCHQLSFYHNLKFLLKNALWSTLPFLLDYGTLATNRLQSWKSWFSRWQWSAIVNLIPEESRLQLLDESAIRPLLRIVYANTQAAHQYKPQRYSNRITLFKAAEQSDSLGNELTLGWSALASDIQIHQVPGNHLSLLKQPHVQTLAQQLGQYLL
jgi:amino acid adenylation domain-containing protein